MLTQSLKKTKVGILKDKIETFLLAGLGFPRQKINRKKFALNHILLKYPN